MPAKNRLRISFAQSDWAALAQAAQLVGTNPQTFARMALLSRVREVIGQTVSEEQSFREAIRVLLRSGHHTVEDLAGVLGSTLRPQIKAHLAAMEMAAEVTKSKALSRYSTVASNRGTELYWLAEQNPPGLAADRSTQAIRKTQ